MWLLEYYLGYAEAHWADVAVLAGLLLAAAAVMGTALALAVRSPPPPGFPVIKRLESSNGSPLADGYSG